METLTGKSRIIALVDMDCFYVQVEERDDPSIKGTPAAVVQYKAYKGGAIIAVNYEARAKGVSRNIRGDEAKALCPELTLVRVPETRGKADLQKYRDAGREVIQVLTDFSDCVERASIDEAYIDLTTAVEERLNHFLSAQGDPTASCEQSNILKALDKEAFTTNFVMGFESTTSWMDMMTDNEMMMPLDDVKLAIGAEIVGKMREAVFQETGFRCSAGIAHNKVLAKLCAGINKPNKQTVLPHSSVAQLWAETKIKKVRNLGGKLGDFLVDTLKCELMSDLLKYSEKELLNHLGSKAGSWIYHLARGYDTEAVNPRQLPKSIGCNKNFLGPEVLVTKDKVKHWLQQLAAEVSERIQKDFEMNNRRARTLTLHVSFEDKNSLSRSCRLHPQFNSERIRSEVWVMMEKLYKSLGVLPVNMLGLVASKFEDEAGVSGYSKISNFFENCPRSESSASTTLINSNKIPSSSTTFVTSTAGTSKTLGSSTIANKNNIVVESRASTTKMLPSCSSSNDSLDAVQPEKTDPPFELISTAIANETSPHKNPKSTRSLGPGVESSPKLHLTQECERCGKQIAIWEYVTHMDFHVARDLSREINGLSPLGFDVRPETLEDKERQKDKINRDKIALQSPAKRGSKRPRGRGGGGTKRGRPGTTTGSPSKPPVKSIDAYFIKKIN